MLEMTWDPLERTPAMPSVLPKSLHGIMHESNIRFSVAKLSSILQRCLYDGGSRLSVVRTMAHKKLYHVLQATDLQSSYGKFVVALAMDKSYSKLVESTLKCLREIIDATDVTGSFLGFCKECEASKIASDNEEHLSDPDIPTVEEATVTVQNCMLAITLLGNRRYNCRKELESLLEMSMDILELCTSWVSANCRQEHQIAKHYDNDILAALHLSEKPYSLSSISCPPVVDLAKVCLDMILVVVQSHPSLFVEYCCPLHGVHRICSLLKNHRVGEPLRSLLCRFLLMIMTHVGASTVLALESCKDDMNTNQDHNKHDASPVSHLEKSIPTSESYMTTPSPKTASLSETTSSVGNIIAVKEMPTYGHYASTVVGIQGQRRGSFDVTLDEVKQACQKAKDDITSTLGADVALMVQRTVPLENEDADMLLDRLATALTLFIHCDGSVNQSFL